MIKINFFKENIKIILSLKLKFNAFKICHFKNIDQSPYVQLSILLDKNQPDLHRFKLKSRIILIVEQTKILSPYT